MPLSLFSLGYCGNFAVLSLHQTLLDKVLL
nr:MAG TPA: protein of unknown function UPF0492 [Caudoviricetes sp.]